MAAPLIIRDQRDHADQQEVVVMLADFSFTPPEQIFRKPEEIRLDGGHGEVNEDGDADVDWPTGARPQ